MKHVGIIVFGYRRPLHLRNVLESLRRQGALGTTHVWIDGYAHASEYREQVESCRSLKAEYGEAQWAFINGRLGIEKLMLDGLSSMAREHERIIVLEDDCFPTANAVETFLHALDAIENDPTVFSVYGHPFVIPNEHEGITRFQGWGWATTRKKLVPVLSQLKAMFMMPEPEYLAWTAEALTSSIVAKLDITPGRDVCKVLSRQYSWDSATALLTAILGMSHRPTSERVVYNCGLGEGSGHFQHQSDHFRRPPFNLIDGEEVWQYFHGPLAPHYAGRTYFGLNELDRKIAEHVTAKSGFFVEVGANDGLNQTNTLYFERLGWSGLLIEPVRENFEKCRKHRPLARVIHSACVGRDFRGTEVAMVDVGLMSLVEGARGKGRDEQEWIRRGEEVQQIKHKQCYAPARTLTAILDEQQVEAIDLLSIDVEGYEAQVLDGLDLTRIRPRYIVIEDSGVFDLVTLMSARNYQLVAVLDQRNYTRDLLFAKQEVAAACSDC